MRSIWKVWFSKRRKIYFRIARKFHTTPWKVYRLGHGGMSKNKKDIKIRNYILYCTNYCV